MTAGYHRIGIHPAKALEPGRYALDATGRLHPVALSRFVKAVCMVTVRAKVRIEPEPIFTVEEVFGGRRFGKIAKPDYAALADRFRANSAKPKAEKRVPTKRAESREPCDLCGVPGFRGCDHQLAFEGVV